MIEPRETGLALSGPVLRALSEFLVEDRDHPNKNCIAIESGDVCASDGHSAVRFVFRAQGDGLSLRPYEGAKWPRFVIDEELDALKTAREAERKALIGKEGAVVPGPFRLDERAVVVLPWARAMTGWYALSKVEPKDGIAPEGPILFDSRLMARLEPVCRACRRAPGKDEKLEDVPFPNALLVAFRGPLEPMRFHVGSEASERSAHEAFVTVMPAKRDSRFEQRFRQRVEQEASKPAKKPRRSRAKKAVEVAT